MEWAALCVRNISRSAWPEAEAFYQAAFHRLKPHHSAFEPPSLPIASVAALRHKNADAPAG